jgi:hypothetical protein
MEITMSKSENIREDNPVRRHFLNQRSRAYRHGLADALMGRECMTEQFREFHLQKEYLKGYTDAVEDEKYSVIVAQSRIDAVSIKGDPSCRF